MHSPSTPSRRTFLAGAAVLTASLAACTSGDDGEAAPSADLGFARTAVQPFARAQHAIALLPGGLVLLIGGRSGSGMLSSCQVLDPGSGEWYDAAPLSRPRGLLTADPLQDGKVLCLGGWSGTGAVTSASVFDPVADSWAPAKPLSTPRYQHATQALGNGRFLLTGGLATSPLTSFELYEVN